MAATSTASAPFQPPAGGNTHHQVMDSPVGELTLVTDGCALTGLYLAEHRHTDRTGWGLPVPAGDQAAPEVLGAAAGQLSAYFDGQRTTFLVPLAPRGTTFQRQVWAALLQIPFGDRISYGTLAARLGAPGAARAVGLANGRNPISIIVPCHRVVGATGDLTGYGGGIERKRALLALEERVSGSTLW